MVLLRGGGGSGAHGPAGAGGHHDGVLVPTDAACGCGGAVVCVDGAVDEEDAGAGGHVCEDEGGGEEKGEEEGKASERLHGCGE